MKAKDKMVKVRGLVNAAGPNLLIRRGKEMEVSESNLEWMLNNKLVEVVVDNEEEQQQEGEQVIAGEKSKKGRPKKS